MRETHWLEEFHETCQDILEDVFLLDAVSQYVFSDCFFIPGKKSDYFPNVYHRLCAYLSQHAAELRRLEKQLEPDLPMKSGP